MAKYKHPIQPWPCPICGEMVNPYYGDPKRRSMRKGKNWKGGKKRTEQGYIYVLASPDHPIRGRKNGRRRYITEHRLMMERHLGRHLNDWEKVHHKNAVKDDNRIENLELVTRKVHLGQVICPHCGETFSIR